MDLGPLPPIDGQVLAWAVVISTSLTALGLTFIHLRRNHRAQRLAQAEELRIKRSLSGVIERQLAHCAETRKRFFQLQRRLDNLEQQIWHAGACRRAIGTARRGRALKPLIRRGDLNSAEAHLIEVVHGRRPVQATD